MPVPTLGTPVRSASWPHKGVTKTEKLGIQTLQNPAAPRNSRAWSQVEGMDIQQAARFPSGSRWRRPWDMWKPRYLTFS